jgi:hypothetical protein
MKRIQNVIVTQLPRLPFVFYFAVSGFIGSSTVNDSVARAAIPSNLVSHWRADGDFTDSVGSNHGTSVNSVNFAPGFCGKGQAFDFDGSDYVLLPTMTFGPEWTIAATVNMRKVTDGTHNIFGVCVDNNATSPSDVCTGLDYQVANIDIREGGRVVNNLSPTFAPKNRLLQSITGRIILENTWSHITVTLNARTNEAVVYLNGIEQEGTVGINGSAGNDSFQSQPSIGALVNAGAEPVKNYVDGRIDNVMYFDRQLSDQDVLSIARPGDINGDNQVDEIDIDMLGTAVATGTFEWVLDLNADNRLDRFDYELLSY